MWKEINETRFNYAEQTSKPIEVITKEAYLLKYWVEKGFKEFRKNGRYIYLRREIDS